LRGVLCPLEGQYPQRRARANITQARMAENQASTPPRDPQSRKQAKSHGSSRCPTAKASTTRNECLSRKCAGKRSREHPAQWIALRIATCRSWLAAVPAPESTEARKPRKKGCVRCSRSADRQHRGHRRRHRPER
jgi:hypothetical protein